MSTTEIRDGREMMVETARDARVSKATQAAYAALLERNRKRAVEEGTADPFAAFA